mmetsp:Transcript_39507/g.37973  ORF Transcript_39507/g.37973 Transcript_39507/m.37973 type:complete len:217 (+) Transcript_39507:396-1046(+)
MIRILNNYMSEIMVISYLNLNWPEKVLTLFSVFSYSQGSDSLIKVNCLFQNLELPPEFGFYFIGMVFFALLPLVFAIVSCVIALVVSLFRRKAYKFFIALNFYFFLTFYLSITDYNLGIFTCTEVEEVFYLQRDLNYECWTDLHKSIIYKYSLPAILLWVIGVPIGLTIYLRKHKADLSTPEQLKMYGIFYIGFTDNYFYWQLIVINFRRIIYVML